MSRLSELLSRKRVIHIVAWPRTGGRWLRDLIVDYVIHRKFRNYFEFKFVNHHHYLPKETDIKDEAKSYIFTTRDPRDSIVSSYFHYCRGKKVLMMELSLFEFVKLHFTIGDIALGNTQLGWKEYHERWLELIETYPSIIRTSHEILYRGREKEFPRILQSLGIPIRKEWLSHSIAKSYQQAKRVPYIRKEGWGNTSLTAAAGQFGEWKNFFDERTEEFVKDYCLTTMERLGYQW